MFETPSPNQPDAQSGPPGGHVDYLFSGGPRPRRRLRPPERLLNVIVVGGGPAALEAALALRASASRTAQVTLLAPRPTYAYRPLSVIAPFAADVTREYPLEHLAGRGISVVEGSLTEVEVAGRAVRTGSGEKLTYDALIVATGARARRALPQAITFGTFQDVEAMRGLIEDLDDRRARRIAFVAPVGARWTLPLYELALQTAERARDTSRQGAEITVVTHEPRPLGVFGPGAARQIDELLGAAGLTVIPGARPSAPGPGRIVTGTQPPAIEVDRVVALAVPTGRRITGLPSDEDDFLPVDRYGRVRNAEHVYAAGDGTSHLLKQGGLATQQADTAVAALLADAELGPAAQPYHPILRGLLIAGRRTLYLRREGTGEHVGEASERVLWWPPAKIAGRFLAPFLDELDAKLSATSLERRRATRDGAIRRRAVLGRVVEGSEDSLIALIEGSS